MTSVGAENQGGGEVMWPPQPTHKVNHCLCFSNVVYVIDKRIIYHLWDTRKSSKERKLCAVEIQFLCDRVEFCFLGLILLLFLKKWVLVSINNVCAKEMCMCIPLLQLVYHFI